MNILHYRDIEIPVTETFLFGTLAIPEHAAAVVIFSGGSGSSRKNAWNQKIAQQLQQHSIGTLLFDLLTEEEDKNYYNRFNIDLLSHRLIAVTKWLSEQDDTQNCRIGYFGTTTGAASAIKAAAVLPGVGAVVSCGGRPDLAIDVLQKVTTPVLLMAGRLDYDVLQLNEVAYAFLKGEKKMKILDGASHLFEEENALENVAGEAISWFEKYLIHVESNRKVYV